MRLMIPTPRTSLLLSCLTETFQSLTIRSSKTFHSGCFGLMNGFMPLFLSAVSQLDNFFSLPTIFERFLCFNVSAKLTSN